MTLISSLVGLRELVEIDWEGEKNNSLSTKRD